MMASVTAHRHAMQVVHSVGHRQTRGPTRWASHPAGQTSDLGAGRPFSCHIPGNSAPPPHNAGFWLRLGNIGDGYDFPPGFAQFRAGVRAARPGDRHRDRFPRYCLRGRTAETEEALARLAPRRFGIAFARASGERGRSPSPFPLLDFRAQSLDRSVLLRNELNQLLATERVQSVQDPGCTIFALRPGLLNQVTS
jgi:hypothetical protein